MLKRGRSLAGIIPNVVLEESHTDELTITNHPVERGASITDHAFKNPSQVTVHYGFGQSGALLSALSGASDPKTVYQQLLDIQASRIPFDLVTGKRSYSNMLIATLSETTDLQSENVLIVTATMREILIVDTSVVTLAPADAQASPEKTAGAENAGTKQAQEKPSVSLLYRAKTAIQSSLGF
ncbi:phage baseplate protein [Caballeronia sp. INDeC2]|uniref:phage baseplate protein n=1 Tax=Caballeronia sp. INDeC2 TaxID=2921747 RepID=UPI0020291E86|nr:hypothetical protein [Caballeronia sp. INDeC2]